MPVATDFKDTVMCLKPALQLSDIVPSASDSMFSKVSSTLSSLSAMEIDGASTPACMDNAMQTFECDFKAETDSIDAESDRSDVITPSSCSDESPMDVDRPVGEAAPHSPPSPALSCDEPSKRLLIVFDWDDTLLCSSFLSSKGYRLDTPIASNDRILELLKELEASAVGVVQQALALPHCDVQIITNAETGWVELSAAKFMPGILPLLNRLTVISARSTYESQFPEKPQDWKTSAFRARVRDLLPVNEKIAKHVISFGDSHVEREACRTVARELSNAFTKSVKFADRPTMEQLRRQLDLVNNCFDYIHTHEGDLDLMLTISLVY
jgi:hypothetical protein